MRHALIVDDDPAFAPALAEFIQQEGFEISIADSLKKAREYLRESVPDLILVDLLLPDGSGLELIDETEEMATPRFIVITGNPSVATAVEALRAQVYDYLVKPLNIEQLQKCLSHFKSEEASSLQSKASRSASNGRETRLGPLLGASEPMQELYQAIRKVAPSEATVFLQGESGTGKELAAQAIHELSGRRGPFLAVNCGAVSPELIATELFGHERGSFTGASRQHKGFFERVSGGTLLLDEITEMSLEHQVHLLRVLETDKVIRLGGDTEIPVDVRVISATNQRPRDAVIQGKLREDLFFRLMVFPINLPPLRKRGGDIGLLARHFLDTLNQEQGADKKLSPGALTRLKQHYWPGNVRELKHTIQSAFLLAEDELRTEDLPLWAAAGQLYEKKSADPLQFPVGSSLENVERHLIYATLDHFNGSKKLAAETLGVSLKTLYNRLKQYEEQQPQ